jgi:hypothetical protein
MAAVSDAVRTSLGPKGMDKMVGLVAWTCWARNLMTKGVAALTSWRTGAQEVFRSSSVAEAEALAPRSARRAV